MAFENKQQGTYFTILNGKFTIRVPEGTHGAVSRVNKIGKTVYEVQHDAFVGKLVGIQTRESQDYGKSWIFVFKDGDYLFNLQLSYSNSFAVALLKMLPNIDLSKPFKMTPSVKQVDGKQQSALFINQNDQPIKHAFTRENPNGMPDLEKKKIKGQDVWDDSARLEFLQAMVDEQIIPKLDEVGKVSPNLNAAPSDDVEIIDQDKPPFGDDDF